jgi:Proteasome complex subunit Rpn13 ubiquitin receptor/UCH-binding domain
MAVQVKLEFKAGKMINENNKLKPDLRKGKIQIAIDESEISHFLWKDEAGNLEDDYIIFPGEFKFSKVVQTKSRVYLLEFGEDRYFYWLQDPDSSNDLKICESINKLLGYHPPEEKKLDTSGLAKVLESFTKSQQIPDLEEILTPDILKSLTEDLSKYPDLIELLPENQKSSEFLRENLISAQLQQALQVLSGAIRSEGGPAIFATLGLQAFDQSPFNADPLERFLKALQAKSNVRNNRK